MYKLTFSLTAISTADVGTSSMILSLSSISFICTVDLLEEDFFDLPP